MDKDYGEYLREVNERAEREIKFPTNEELIHPLLRQFTGLKGDSHGEHTPTRFLNMLDELTACKFCVGDCIKWKYFDADSDNMIFVERIPFASVCNHHIIPFVGYAYIAYVPDNWIAGLSKFVRLTKHFARQLQVQERLTEQIAQFINEQLQPKGLAVVLRAEHLCMTIRGAQAPGTYTTTAHMSGVFRDQSRTAHEEFMAYMTLNGGHK